MAYGGRDLGTGDQQRWTLVLRQVGREYVVWRAALVHNTGSLASSGYGTYVTIVDPRHAESSVRFD